VKTKGVSCISENYFYDFSQNPPMQNYDRRKISRSLLKHSMHNSRLLERATGWFDVAKRTLLAAFVVGVLETVVVMEQGEF